MKIICLTLLLICFQLNCFSQVNPLGLYVDIDGKVKYWTAEANYNGNIDDSVFVTCGNSISIQDLRNIKFDHLTILVAADDEWTAPSSGDPSILYDTTRINEESNNQNIQFDPTDMVLTYTLFETPKSDKKSKRKDCDILFKDEFTGVGLTDSILQIVKGRLSVFVNENRGKQLSFEVRNDLYMDLSFYDTVIEKQIIYDYLVDKAIIHNYKKGKLMSTIAYHWNYGVEYDSFSYDKRGNLIHFSRENIGADLKEIDFEYDKKGRVVSVKSRINYRGNSTDDTFEDTYKDEYKFTYDNSGQLNSKLTLLDGGKWLTCTYMLKEK